jgi:hypothetical protein
MTSPEPVHHPANEGDASLLAPSWAGVALPPSEDDDCGYPPSDPKSPGWYDRMTAIWDERGDR